MTRFTGKVAIVTGAALSESGGFGMGGATARLLAGEGARLVCADIDGTSAERLAAELVATGAEAVALQVNLGQPDAARAVVPAAVDRFGGIDLLINVAAATGPDVAGRDLDLVSMDLDVWTKTLAVNLTGTMLLCQQAIPAMLARGGGAIVNVSSPAGELGDTTRPAYGVSKAGVNLLTQHIATTYGHDNIRCNAVLPGATLSENARKQPPPEFLKMLHRHHPCPRLGEPENLAAAIAFLASEDAAYINGAIVPVDGGLTSHLAFAEETREIQRTFVNATR